MDDDNKPVPVKSSEELGKHGSSRRSWLKKAGTASPGLLLLANRPAMASSCSISGFMSAEMGTSLTKYDPSTCNGWSPDDWQSASGTTGKEAWDITGCAPGTSFSSEFTTLKLATVSIRKVIDGTPEPTQISYTSQISSGLQSLLGGGSSSIQGHAIASYLNAKFLQNGGATFFGGTPEPWMSNYPAPDYIVGMYLMWELTYGNTLPAFQLQPGEYYQLETAVGVLIGRSDFLTDLEFKNFFEIISDGSAGTWS